MVDEVFAGSSVVEGGEGRVPGPAGGGRATFRHCSVEELYLMLETLGR